MRIISKHKDYYDGALSFGIDKDNVFIRNQSSVELRQMEQDMKSRLKDFDLYNGYAIIGFCGKLFFMRDMIKSQSKSIILNPKDSTNYIVYGDVFSYGLEKDGTYYSGGLNYERFKVIKDEKYRKNKWGGVKWMVSSSEGVILRNQATLQRIFQHYRVPYFMLTNKELHLLPILKDINFYTQVNPYDAFQQIQHFLSNELAQDTQVEVPVGGDDIIRKSKGYDDMSFKKEPGQKKRTRRLGKFAHKKKKKKK